MVIARMFLGVLLALLLAPGIVTLIDFPFSVFM